MKSNGTKEVATPITFQTVELTPARAMELLASADPNRTVHERRVNSYARDMIAGEWELNGETVKFAPDGKLMDGEHRLWGVVRADRPVPMILAFNVPREARRTVDTGKSRSYADVLKIRGYGGQGRVISSILRYIVLYRAGALSSVKGRIQVTHSEMDAVYTEKATIEALESFTVQWSRRVRYGAAVGFVWWRARQDDETKADAWIEGVARGTEMKGTDPRFQLRERYAEATVRPLQATEAIALAIKSWNLYLLDDVTSTLRWRQRGNAAEGFPEFAGDQQKSKRTGLTAEEKKVVERKKDRSRPRA